MAIEEKYKCTECERKFSENEFNYSQDTDMCILHCEKEDWYDVSDGIKNWDKSNDEINYFWRTVRKVIENRNNDYYFKQGSALDLTKIVFPKFEKIHTETDEDGGGYIHVVDWEGNFSNQNIANTNYYSYHFDFALTLNGSIFLDDVDFSDYTFEDDIFFDNVIFKGKCTFNHTSFSKVSFTNTKFFKTVLFSKGKLNSYSYNNGDFENAVFHENVDFLNIKFGDDTNKDKYDLDFKNTTFKKVSFNKCTFNKGMRFNTDAKLDYLRIKDTNFNKLHIGAEVPFISIVGNKNTINRNTINNFLLKDNKLDNLLIYNYIIKSNFLLNDRKERTVNSLLKLKNIYLSESTFEGKVKLQFYDIERRAVFYNTKFENLADFYQTKFRNTVFERTDFKGVTVFSEAEFLCNVNFKYTKFLAKSIFRDTVITGSLNLRDSIFNQDGNFLDITSNSRKVYNLATKKDDFIGESQDIKVANRETARVIKNLFDNSNNIIEANRFYKLEMKEREKELEIDRKNILENLIFKFHGSVRNSVSI